jgi:hypothetical protein
MIFLDVRKLIPYYGNNTGADREVEAAEPSTTQPYQVRQFLKIVERYNLKLVEQE